MSKTVLGTFDFKKPKLTTASEEIKYPIELLNDFLIDSYKWRGTLGKANIGARSRNGYLLFFSHEWEDRGLSFEETCFPEPNNGLQLVYLRNEPIWFRFFNDKFSFDMDLNDDALKIINRSYKEFGKTDLDLFKRVGGVEYEVEVPEGSTKRFTYEFKTRGLNGGSPSLTGFIGIEKIHVADDESRRNILVRVHNGGLLVPDSFVVE